MLENNFAGNGVTFPLREIQVRKQHWIFAQQTLGQGMFEWL